MKIEDRRKREAASRFLRNSLLILRRYYGDVGQSEGEAGASGENYIRAATKVVRSTPAGNVIAFPAGKAKGGSRAS